MASSFTAVGDVMVDLRVVRGGGTHEASIRLHAGGTAANAAVWAAAAGAAATCVGRVGDDLAAGALEAALRARGVRPALARDPEAPTGSVAHLDGELAVDRGANRALAEADLTGLDVDAVLVSGFALLHADSAPAARAALAGASGWTAATAGSPGLAERAGDALADARVLVANAAEARALTGAEPEEAARLLATRHDVACVTLGAEGALLAADGTVIRHAAAVGADGAGAGDAFAATLLVALVEGLAHAEALARACAAGAAAAASADGWP